MGFGYGPYVSAAGRRLKSELAVEKLRKKGVDAKPITLDGTKIASTFWGKSWCTHLESYSDFESRLPRGRSYVRSGCVCHLEIERGLVKALVSGSSMYQITIKIEPLDDATWSSVKERSSGQIGSLLELLQGRLSDSVMRIVTNRDNGLFPSPNQISLLCNCPDWALMCKHVAAVLYGVGARLDHEPSLLFLLRGVDHEELINANAAAAATGTAPREGRRRIGDDELSDIFGIDVIPLEQLESGDDAVTNDQPQAGAGTPRVRQKSNVKKTTTVQPLSQETVSLQSPSPQSLSPQSLPPSSLSPQSLSRKIVSQEKDPQPNRSVSAKAKAAPLAKRTTTVSELRSFYKMKISELAWLFDVSDSTIRSWEKSGRELKLEPGIKAAIKAFVKDSSAKTRK